MIAGYGAIAAGIPYLVLKVIWLLGIPVGAGDAAHAAELLDGTHVVGNLVTVGLEVVAIVLALAFTHSWRIPGPLLLVPIWVGTGLLAPIALGIPAGFALQLFAGGSPSPDPVDQGWIFTLVYGGFTVQAVFLMIAFVGYARRRWAYAFEPSPAAWDQVQAMLAYGAAVPALAYGCVHLVWTFTGGPPGFETVAQRTALFVTGLVVIAGVIGVVALVRQRRTPVTLAMAWVGASTTFASGLHGAGDGGLIGMIFQGGMLAGLLLGIAGLLNLTVPREPAYAPKVSLDGGNP
jgi:hypothetical protein